MTQWTPAQQAAHRKALVKALRSGKYKQAKHYLRVGNAFCCLGVACDVAKKDLGVDRKDDCFLGATKHMPMEVRDYYGFAGIYGPTKTYWSVDSRQRNDLSRINDVGSLFDQIAEIIEQDEVELV